MNPEPVNGHLLIEPLKHESFFGGGKFEEVGVVVAIADNLSECDGFNHILPAQEGDRVFFDAWLAGKFPKPDGAEDDYFWLVNWKDVKAIIRKENVDKIPE